MEADITTRLDRIEAMLATLAEQQTAKDFYEVEEFARLPRKAPFTVREHCRLGRLKAEKRLSGRGPSRGWVIAHHELKRYQQQGLLPRSR